MLKFVKFLIGIALLPLTFSVTMVFADIVSGQAGWRSLELTSQWFIGGFIIWVILFYALPRPVLSYILAHELTHALWGILMGARVSKLKVSDKGGSVTLTKSNMWITLAPYFFPFYSMLALCAFLLLSLKLDMTHYLPFWYAVFGFTWSFHITFTISMIGSHQPDIREHGRLFSYVVIYVINLLTAIILIALLAGSSLPDVWAALRDTVGDAYRFCWNATIPHLRILFEKAAEILQ